MYDSKTMLGIPNKKSMVERPRKRSNVDPDRSLAQHPDANAWRLFKFPSMSMRLFHDAIDRPMNSS